MKVAYLLLLASGALLSTIFVADARSIMAVNQQDNGDNEEAILQDLYDNVVNMEQQDDDGGNKVAKAQLLGTLAGILLPTLASRLFGWLKENEKLSEVQIQQNWDSEEAELQDLYDLLSKQAVSQEVDYNTAAQLQDNDYDTAASTATVESDENGDDGAQMQFLSKLFGKRRKSNRIPKRGRSPGRGRSRGRRPSRSRGGSGRWRSRGGRFGRGLLSFGKDLSRNMAGGFANGVAGELVNGAMNRIFQQPGPYGGGPPAQYNYY